MKVNELRELSNQEITEKINDFREELFNLRFQQSMNRLENHMRISIVRKSIAKAKTILRERELKEVQNGKS